MALNSVCIVQNCILYSLADHFCIRLPYGVLVIEMFLQYQMHMQKMDNRRPCSFSIKRHERIGLAANIFSRSVDILF